MLGVAAVTAAFSFEAKFCPCPNFRPSVNREVEPKVICSASFEVGRRVAGPDLVEIPDGEGLYHSG